MSQTIAGLVLSPKPLAVRLLTYLIERFSLLSALPALVIHYVFITNYVYAYSQSADRTRWATGLVTFIGVFLILRFSDDMKDKHHDDRYYSGRPLQRGLVTLRELMALLIATTTLLAILNLLFSTPAGLVLFLATLVYLLLMRFEFFVPQFLRPRLLLYLATHQIFVPILVLFVIYHNGGRVYGPRDGLFVLLNLLVIMSVEVARKIRPSALDRTGRDTYSAYLGRGPSVIFLLTLLGIVQWLFFATVQSPAWGFLLLLMPMIAGAYYVRVDTRRSANMLLAGTVLLLTLNMVMAL